MRNHLGNEMNLEYFGKLQTEENKVVVDVDRLIEERWQASLELDVRGKLLAVCHAKRYNPISIDDDGRSMKHKSGGTPRRMVHLLFDKGTAEFPEKSMASICWDGCGLSVRLQDGNAREAIYSPPGGVYLPNSGESWGYSQGELYSCHPGRRFIIPHPVIGIFLSFYPIAIEEMKKANIECANHSDMGKMGILGVQFD